MLPHTLDYDPYSVDLVFWDDQEYGPTVTEGERIDRVSVAQEIAECWDRLRDPAPRLRTNVGILHLMVNNACGRLVQAFGETMKLPHKEAIVLMEQMLAEKEGHHKSMILLASAGYIERYARRVEVLV